MRTIPLSEVASLLPPSSGGTYVIDETASGLAFELESRSIHVPPHLHPGKDQITGYHYFAGYPRIAERLWKAGFRDVNGRDSIGRTPLMVRTLKSPFKQWFELIERCHSFIQWLEYVTWILSKGADLYATQDLAFLKGQCGTKSPHDWQPLSRSAISLVAWKIGAAFALQEKTRNLSLHKRTRTELFPILFRKKPTKNTPHTLRRIVLDCTTDDCTCSCSESGCTLRGLIGRSYTNLAKNEDLHKRTSDYGGTIIRLAYLTDTDVALGSAETLRLLTFQELGLTHTCCYVRCVNAGSDLCIFSRIEDQTEINEIREEESLGLSQLEELLMEFELKMDELDIPFPDFLTDYWEPRMEQVLDESEVKEIRAKMDEPFLNSESAVDENLDQGLEIDTAPQGLASVEEGDNGLPNVEVESDYTNCH